MALIKFNIPNRSRRCYAGNEEFTQGSEYVSVLEESEGEGYERKDYCTACWAKEPATGKIHWKSKVPVKKQESEKDLRRDERALKLLRELVQKDYEEDAVQALILAMLLQRKKMLQFKQEVVDEEDGAVLLYEVAATEEMLTVKKVDITTVDDDEVQRVLIEKLSPAPTTEPSEGGHESE